MMHISKQRPVRRSVLCVLVISLFCLGLCTEYAPAKRMDESEVRTAVETWVRYVTADAREDATIGSIEPYLVDGQAAAYIVEFEGGGFCLCGADDLVMPVYLYNPHGAYDPNNSDLRYILGEIAERTDAYRQGLADKSPELEPYRESFLNRSQYWADLISGKIPEVSPDKGADSAPNQMQIDGLSCTWGQGSPYNDYCPNLTPSADERAVVGCVATGMAQIMYYWKWPNTGQGGGSTMYYYRWSSDWLTESLANDPGIPSSAPWLSRLRWNQTSDGGDLQMSGYWDETLFDQALSISTDPNFGIALALLWAGLTPDSAQHDVTFGEATYQWDMMQDTHSDPPSASSGDYEAAEISYHAGVAVGMNYGLNLSLSSTTDVPPALSDHFRYDPDVARIDVNASTMRTEIQWLRPLGMRGRDTTNAGHFWVVFGYNSTNSQFLMNMGWGGGSTSWYTVDSIPGNFNLNQKLVTLIAPESNVRFVGASTPGNGSPADPCETIEDALVIVPNGGTLIFKAGTTNTFSSASLTISGINLTLKGEDVIIQGAAR